MPKLIPSEKLSIAMFILAIICIFVFFTMTSCRNEKWAVRKISKIAAFQPTVLEDDYIHRYPVKTFDSVRVDYYPGETVYRTDTVVIHDTTTGENIIKIVTNTISKHDTVVKTAVKTIESTVTVERAKAENKKLSDKITIIESDKAVLKSWNKNLIIALSSIVAYLVLKFCAKRFFPASKLLKFLI